jgi:hypothetical protein
MAAPHEALRTGHRRCLGQQTFRDRLAHREQRIPALAAMAIGLEPSQHLIGAVVAPPPPQGNQPARIEVAAEAQGGIPPGTGMQGLGVEQKTIKVKEAGGRTGHRSSMPGR